MKLLILFLLLTSPVWGQNQVASGQVSLTITAKPVHYVYLTWYPSTSTVSGYRVYRGIQSGVYTFIGATAALAFSDVTVSSGKTYYYAVTAFDSGNNESIYSNEATAVIP
jgi:fibronectin type 3 domain-containing protein